MYISDNVSSRGSGAGIAASSYRGSAVKGTEVSNFYEQFELVFLIFLGIFVSPSYNATRMAAPEELRDRHRRVKL
jgi:hypothetical protein